MGIGGGSPSRCPSSWRSASCGLSRQSNVQLFGIVLRSFSKRCRRRSRTAKTCSKLPPKSVRAHDSSNQNPPSQAEGTMPRSRQISAIVRPTERRRTWASSSFNVGIAK